MFPQKDIEAGKKVESEHTSDEATQKKIAVDHLKEDKDYYRKLAIMESTPLSRLQKLRKCMSMKIK